MDVSKYQHGGEPNALFKRLGIAEREVTDFSVNLNYRGVPEVVQQKWQSMMTALTTYPSLNGDGVSKLYMTKYQLPNTAIVPANGSAEMMYRVAAALHPRRVVVFHPSFYHYEKAFVTSGSEVIHTPLSHLTSEATIDGRHILNCCQNADAVIIGNPNNPTGDVIAREALIDFTQNNPEKYLIVDEAFMPFVERPGDYSVLKDVVHHPNLLVLHSLTKFYALPGIRLGALLAHPSIASRLKSTAPPWMINTIGERIANDLLNCDDFDRDSIHSLSNEKRRLQKEYETIEGVTVSFGAANFAFAKWRKTEELDDLHRFLLSQGLHVRDCRNFKGIQDQAFRFAVLHPSQNDRLSAALKKIAST